METPLGIWNGKLWNNIENFESIIGTSCGNFWKIMGKRFRIKEIIVGNV
jgi:hypothetical protein